MENLNLIRKMAWSFSEKTNIEFEELFSEAALAYCEAMEEFDPDRGTKFTTFAWWCMKNHLINFCKQETKFNDHFKCKEEFPEELHPMFEEITHDRLEEIIGGWPRDCQITVKMVLDNPEKYLGKTPNFTRTDKTPLARVKESLRNRNWRWSRIEETIRSIKNFINKKKSGSSTHENEGRKLLELARELDNMKDKIDNNGQKDLDRAYEILTNLGLTIDNGLEYEPLPN